MMELQRRLNKAFKQPAKRDLYYGRAKRLANHLGVKITIERDQCGNGYWIEDRRLSGDAFCTSWQEVFEKLQSLTNTA